MHKITLLFVMPWAMACHSITGMYSDTRGPLIPFSKEQLRALIDHQEKTIMSLQISIASITETLRLIHDTNQATQALADRIHHLEQQLRVNQNSIAKKIFSHPGTWITLIALYYVATKYYEYRHKEKIEKNEEQVEQGNAGDHSVFDNSAHPELVKG